MFANGDAVCLCSCILGAAVDQCSIGGFLPIMRTNGFLVWDFPPGEILYFRFPPMRNPNMLLNFTGGGGGVGTFANVYAYFDSLLGRELG